jgi:hypothetical protein
VAEQLLDFRVCPEHGPSALSVPDGVRLLVIRDTIVDIDLEAGENRGC